MEKGFIIAIDGPVAAGKGTFAPKLAAQVNGLYLYTGAMYRCVALACLQKGLDIHNEEQVAVVLPDLAIHFEGEKVFLNTIDVTEKIKEQEVANGASIVATYATVRDDLVQKQQQIGKDAIEKGQIVVSEGRDTGTRVFPDATIKIYLTASDEVRAKRRMAQSQSQGREVSFEQVLKDIQERDKRDKERSLDPLPSNPEELGYFIVDNSEVNEEKTIMTELKRRELI